MQDPIPPQFQSPMNNPQFPIVRHQDQNQEHRQQLKCPRCESTNTKFCYYNNYNLSQPRHFCKNCRRYWTKGGALRNIPVGGGSRKNSKRSSSDDSNPNPNPKRLNSADPKPEPEPVKDARPVPTPTPTPPSAAEDRMLQITGSFSSLLQSNGPFGNFLDGFDSGAVSDPGEDPNAEPNLLGWPDLAIYTSPGSSF